jgi:hypothetical protein
MYDTKKDILNLIHIMKKKFNLSWISQNTKQFFNKKHFLLSPNIIKLNAVSKIKLNAKTPNCIFLENVNYLNIPPLENSSSFIST